MFVCDLLSEFNNMKINFKIILTRVDALQSLANMQAICFNYDNIVHLEPVLDGEGSKSTKLEPAISLMEKNSEIEALQSKINSLHMKLGKCLRDYDANSNQSPIVIPQAPIVPPQVPITPSLHVKKNHDQTPELQIHVMPIKSS